MSLLSRALQGFRRDTLPAKSRDQFQEIVPATGEIIPVRKLEEYRVLVISDCGSRESKFMNKHFIDTYDPTLDASIRKQCVVDNIVTLLDLSDIDSGTAHGPLERHYIRSAQGFMLAFQYGSRSSFDVLKSWQREISSVKGQEFPAIVVGVDDVAEEERKVTREEGSMLARELNCPFREVVLKKDNAGISEAFHALVREIRRPSEPRSELFAARAQAVIDAQAEASVKPR